MAVFELLCVIQVQILCQECVRGCIIMVVAYYPSVTGSFLRQEFVAKENYQVNMRYMQMRWVNLVFLPPKDNR